MPNPRVTITLGPTGQVVERGGGFEIAGSKRSSVDRQWVDLNPRFAGKRQRRNDNKWSLMGNIRQDFLLSRNDLRLKLTRKRLPKKSLGRKTSTRSDTAPSRKIPRNEGAEDLFLENSLRNPYISHATNGLRALSPPRNVNELWKAQSTRESLVSHSRSTGYIPLAVEARTAKLVSQFAKGNSSMQGGFHMVADGPRIVAGLLQTLGLGKYAILFQAEEVDMTALRQMGDSDLKDLGLPMGPRKKIMLALLPFRPKRQPHQ